MLAGTCVCVTPVASNSRKCPMPAVPSVEGRSKTLLRHTAARKGGPGQKQQVRVQEYELWYVYHSVIIDWFCCDLLQRWCFLTVDGDVTAGVYNNNFFFKPEEHSLSQISEVSFWFEESFWKFWELLLWSKRVTLRTNVWKSRQQQPDSWQHSKQKIVARQPVSVILRIVQDKSGSLWLL